MAESEGNLISVTLNRCLRGGGDKTLVQICEIEPHWLVFRLKEHRKGNDISI